MVADSITLVPAIVDYSGTDEEGNVTHQLVKAYINIVQITKIEQLLPEEYKKIIINGESYDIEYEVRTVDGGTAFITDKIFNKLMSFNYILD